MDQLQHLRLITLVRHQPVRQFMVNLTAGTAPQATDAENHLRSHFIQTASEPTADAPEIPKTARAWNYFFTNN